MITLSLPRMNIALFESIVPVNFFQVTLNNYDIFYINSLICYKYTAHLVKSLQDINVRIVR